MTTTEMKVYTAIEAATGKEYPATVIQEDVRTVTLKFFEHNRQQVLPFFKKSRKQAPAQRDSMYGVKRRFVFRLQEQS